MAGRFSHFPTRFHSFPFPLYIRDIFFASPLTSLLHTLLYFFFSRNKEKSRNRAMVGWLQRFPLYSQFPDGGPPMTRRADTRDQFSRPIRSRRAPFVWCHVETVTLEGENGQEIAGILATCPKCGAKTSSFGTSSRSVSRCLALFSEVCEAGTPHFYGDAANKPRPQTPVEVKVQAALDRIYGAITQGKN